MNLNNINLKQILSIFLQISFISNVMNLFLYAAKMLIKLRHKILSLKSQLIGGNLAIKLNL